jgi:hypothetical protein
VPTNPSYPQQIIPLKVGLKWNYTNGNGGFPDFPLFSQDSMVDYKKVATFIPRDSTYYEERCRCTTRTTVYDYIGRQGWYRSSTFLHGHYTATGRVYPTTGYEVGFAYRAGPGNTIIYGTRFGDNEWSLNGIDSVVQNGSLPNSPVNGMKTSIMGDTGTWSTGWNPVWGGYSDCYRWRKDVRYNYTIYFKPGVGVVFIDTDGDDEDLGYWLILQDFSGN